MNRRITNADKAVWREAKLAFRRYGSPGPDRINGLCRALDVATSWIYSYDIDTRREARLRAQLNTWKPARAQQNWYWWPIAYRRVRLRVLNQLIAGKLGPNR